MAQPTIQRARYDGVAREQAVWWTLRHAATKGEARCRMFTHVFGHELRLEVGGRVIDSQVCRGDEEIISCQEQWRDALEAKGWTARRDPR
jgi:hypothetical protein